MLTAKIKNILFIRSPFYKKIVTVIPCIIIYFFATSFLQKKIPFTDLEKAKLHQILTNITATEKKHLQDFANDILFLSEAPYTIFGSKPLTLVPIAPCPEIQKGASIFIKLCKQWNNQYHFHMFKKGNTDFLLIANLPQIELVYTHNQNLFLKEHITLQTLKTTLIEEKETLHNIINNQYLLGILLGYGTNNAKLFSQNQSLPDNQQIKLYPFSRGHPLYYYYLSPIQPIFFACDPSTKETKALKIRYQNDRKKIKKLHKKHDLFNLALLKFSNHK